MYQNLIFNYEIYLNYNKVFFAYIIEKVLHQGIFFFTKNCPKAMCFTLFLQCFNE